jgi:2'-5' RNA ligase
VLDERPFHAHLTLARIKGRKQADEVRHLLDGARRPSTAACEVDSFVLLESRGGSYLPRATFALGGSLKPETAQ